MKKNIPLVPLIISVALGVTTFILIFNYLNIEKSKQKAVLEEKLKIEKLPEYKVLVAKKDIQEYEVLSEDNLEVLVLKGQQAPKNIFDDINTLKGKFAIYSIVAGDIIQKSSVTVDEKPKSIQDLIPLGMRAVALRIEDTVLDFINPGDKVDLLSEFPNKNGTKYSKLILQNVLVLAKGNKLHAGAGPLGVAQSNQAANMLTFALSVKQVEALGALTNEQRLKVVWRSDKDRVIAKTEGTSANYLIAGDEDKHGISTVSSKFIY